MNKRELIDQVFLSANRMFNAFHFQGHSTFQGVYLKHFFEDVAELKEFIEIEENETKT